MPSVFDVAAFILGRVNKVTHMKLQKLVYYCQAWSLVWDEEPLFPEPIEAWANGPVVPQLYGALRGRYDVGPEMLADKGNGDALTKTQRDTVLLVLDYYGKRDPQYLSDLTHEERPWRDARHGLAPGERGSKEITWEVLAEYYGSLDR